MSLDECIDLLGSRDIRKRQYAIHLLGRMRPPTVRGARALLDAIADDSENALAAIRAFRSCEPILPEIAFVVAADAESEDVEERRTAMGHCGILLAAGTRHGGDVAEHLLEAARRGCSDGDEEVRLRAAHALGSSGIRARACLPALTALLGDPAARVRAVALLGIGHLGPAAMEALPGVLPLFVDRSARVRARSLRAAAALCRDSWDPVPAPGEGAGGAEAPGAVRAGLARGLRDAAPGVMVAALEGLGTVPALTEEERLAIHGLVTHGDRDVRHLARVLAMRPEEPE